MWLFGREGIMLKCSNDTAMPCELARRVWASHQVSDLMSFSFHYAEMNI